MYDKQYYDDRKAALEKRVGELKDGLIGKIGSMWNEFAKDINAIQEDGKDLLAREKSSKEYEERDKEAKEAPKEAESKGASHKKK